MNKTRSVVTVFLASPPGLDEERKLADKIIEHLNARLGRLLGVLIELAKWEDVTPAMGRPQALINRGVTSCNIFIGVLWRKWGEHNGKFSSNFHEEYSLAKERYDREGEPSMLLYFKHVDEGQVSDPGEQLKKVLDFKASLHNEAKYEEFDTAQEWGSKIEDAISEILLEKILSKNNEQVQSASSLAEPEPPSHPSETGTLGTLNTSAKHLAAALATSHDMSVNELWALSIKDVARVNLYARAILVNRYSGDILTVSETNVIYRYRNEMNLAPIEEDLIIRTMLGDPNDYSPGYYWIRSESYDIFIDRVFGYLTFGVSQVRKRILDFLIETNAPLGEIGSTLRTNRLQLILGNIDLGFPENSLKYLIQQLDVSDRDLISTYEGISDGVRDVLLYGIGIRFDTENTLLALLDTPLVNSDILFASIPQDFDGTKQFYFKVVVTSNLRMREYAFVNLAKKDALDAQYVKALFGLKRLLLTQVAADWLISHSHEVDIDEVEESLKDIPKTDFFSLSKDGSRAETSMKATIFRDVLNSYSREKLEGLISWSSGRGALAYQLWAEKGGITSLSIVRSDLDDGFIRLRAEDEKLFSALDTDQNDLIGQWKKLVPYILSSFNSSALRFLKIYGDSSDIARAERVLQTATYPEEANASSAVLGQLGSSSNSDAILARANDLYGQESFEMIAIGLSLAVNPSAKALEIIRIGKPSQVQSSLRFCVDNALRVPLGDLIPVLNSDDYYRRCGVAVYISRFFPSDLGTVLNNYTNGPTYYFDVARILDITLFSPPEILLFYEGKWRDNLV